MTIRSTPQRRISARLHVEYLETRSLLSATFPDFNDDGFDDLAIGIPLEDVEFGSTVVVDAGAVQVIYGSSVGLVATGDSGRRDNEFWTQDSPGVPDKAERDDHFGEALTWGNFNGDAYDDLAIGVPFETLGSGSTQIVRAGAVHILYGSEFGLTAGAFPGRIDFWHQNVVSVLDTAELNDQFGSALTSGDFDDDGADDLAIGVPFESIGTGSATIAQAGAVNVLYGVNGFGLAAAGNQFWHQNALTVLDTAELSDRFGSALTAGDFNNDGEDDLAIGVPFEDLRSGSATIFDAGAVNVLYGSASVGLVATGNQFWHQDSPLVDDPAESGDQFGSALVAGDFDDNGADDLAVGVPFEDIGIGTLAAVNAGAVNVLYGTATSGLTARAKQFWYQNLLSITGGERSERGDQFGAALAAGDFNGDNRDDLAIGVPFEDIGLAAPIADAGAVNVLFGRAVTGLVATGNLFLHQDLGLIEDRAEIGDVFGSALAFGDFDNDGEDDLAIGVPLEDLLTARGTFVDAGAVSVLYGTNVFDPFLLRDDFWHQDIIGILEQVESGDVFGRRLGRR